MTPEEYLALAWILEDALFHAQLKEAELRIAHAILKVSLRVGRTTTPKMLQKDLGKIAGIRETHVAEAIGWLLGKKIIGIERPNVDVYQINQQPQTWLVGDRVCAAGKAREVQLMADEPSFWEQGAIRAGDPAVVFHDAAVGIAAQEAARNFRNPEVSAGANFRNSEVGGLPKSGSREPVYEGNGRPTSEIRKSPIAIGKAKAFLLPVPVQETGQLSAGEGKGTQNCGVRNADGGFALRPALRRQLEEQIDRLEEALGFEKLDPWRGWWRKHAGQSAERVEALRSALDDYADNRRAVRKPSHWLVSTFKKKCRALAVAASV